MLKKEHQLAVVEALEEISEDPYVGKPLTRELTGRFSYRVGVNRIIYRINEPDKSVQVVTAGHRSNVYPPSQKITSVSLRMNAKHREKLPTVRSWEFHN